MLTELKRCNSIGNVELSGISEQFDMTAFGFAAEDDIDIDGLFEETEEKEKEPKQIQCPHCGEWFEA